MKAKEQKLPVRTTTADALLGMLSLRDMSGYEIRQMVEQSTGNFWNESYGQIYPTLKRLLKEGLAEVKPEKAKAAGVAKTVYRLTPAGRTRLRAWLKTPSFPQVPRSEMLLKIFFARKGAPAVVRQQVTAYQAMQRAEVKRYKSLRARLTREHERHPELPYWLMTLDFGAAASEAAVAWCERTLKVAKRLEEAGDAR